LTKNDKNNETKDKLSDHSIRRRMIVFLCPKSIGHICPVTIFNSHKDVRLGVW